MAEVILFRPRDFPEVVQGQSMMPLGLVFVATPLVAEGLSVKIIDTETCMDWENELHSHVDASTICAGVGVMTGFQIHSALEFSAKIKSIRDIPVVWGGLHPSILPEQTLQHPLVDIVVRGEGEEKFRKIVNCLQRKKPLDGIAGIGYKKGTTTHLTPEEERFLQLDDQPFPAYELIDMDHYYYHNLSLELIKQRKRIIDMSMHRGCPCGCAFCYNLEFNRRTWRSMSPQKMLDHLSEAKSRYNVEAVNFVSDNFFVHETDVREFCRGLVERKIDIVWHADMRIDTLLRYDDSLIDLIRRSGCTALGFGIESGSNRMLELIKKGITVEQVLEAHHRLQNYDFLIHYQFLTGLPDETVDDIRQTLRLISELVRSRRVYIHGPNMYMPYPGTPLFNRSLELGFQPPQTLDQWYDYDWSMKSKLSFFTRNYKSFLAEACYFSAAVQPRPAMENLWSKLVRHYRMMRMEGLIRGIRLYNLDVNIILLMKRLLSTSRALVWRSLSRTFFVNVVCLLVFFTSLPAPALSDGYVLCGTLGGMTTILLDTAGAVVHSWHHTTPNGYSIYLILNRVVDGVMFGILREKREVDHFFSEFSS